MTDQHLAKVMDTNPNISLSMSRAADVKPVKVMERSSLKCNSSQMSNLYAMNVVVNVFKNRFLK